MFRISSCFPRSCHSCAVVPLLLVVPVALVISEGLVAHDVLNVPVVLVQWFPWFLWFQWFFSVVLLVLPVFLLNPAVSFLS